MNTIQHQPENLSNRRGVTLTEVLMSLMIMSIGVSAVAVLFPISALRSIQANYLTHGAIVTYNTEALIQSDPRWIIDPDRDGNLVEHFQNPAFRNYVVDPLGYYTHFADGNVAIAGAFGNDGSGPAGNIPRLGGGLLTTFGANESASQADANALRLAALAVANQGDGWDTEHDAVPVRLVTRPDGYIVGAELPADLDLSSVATSAQTLPGTAPAAFLIPDPEFHRVILYSADGKRSQAYPLTHIQGSTVYWGEDIDGDGSGDADFNMSGNVNAIEDIKPLPPEFGGSVSRIILQTRRLNDFSWLLTVRRRSDGFVRNVDVVVRHTNGIDASDERLYHATFVKGTNIIGLRYPYRLNASDGTTPHIAKGKFIFDAQNARWYRIQDYKEYTSSSLGWSFPEYDAVIYTETEIAEAGGEDQFSQYDSTGTSLLLLNGKLDSGQYDQSGNVLDPKVMSPGPPAGYVPIGEGVAFPGNGDGTLQFGFAMIPSGIIDVYSRGSMPMPTSF